MTVAAAPASQATAAPACWSRPTTATTWLLALVLTFDSSATDGSSDRLDGHANDPRAALGGVGPAATRRSRSCTRSSARPPVYEHDRRLRRGSDLRRRRPRDRRRRARLIVTTPASGLHVIEGSRPSNASTAPGLTQYTVYADPRPGAGETVTVTPSSTDPRPVLLGPLDLHPGTGTSPQTVTICRHRRRTVQGDRARHDHRHRSPAHGGASTPVSSTTRRQRRRARRRLGGVLVVQPDGQTVGRRRPEPTPTPCSSPARRPPAHGDDHAARRRPDGARPRRRHAASPRRRRAARRRSPSTAPTGTSRSRSPSRVNPHAPALPSNSDGQPVQVFTGPAAPDRGHLRARCSSRASRRRRARWCRACAADRDRPGAEPVQPARRRRRTSSTRSTCSTTARSPARPGTSGRSPAPSSTSLSALYAPPTTPAWIRRSSARSTAWAWAALTFSAATRPHRPVTFAGGITYRNIDVVDVMLGQRRRHTSPCHNTLPNTITVVQGGGGNNKLIATGGGGYSHRCC